MRTFTLAALVALAGLPASAQELGAWDADSDGQLDEAEFTEGFLEAEAFDRWDLDDDDQVGLAEFAVGLHDLWDADDDGELTVSEWDDAVDLWFGEDAVNLSVENWDEDGDGTISRSELSAGLRTTDLLDRLDTVSDDGLLGEEELSSGLFDVADADDDGLLGTEEDGLLTELVEALVPTGEEEGTSEEVAALEDDEPIADEEGPFEESPGLDVDEPIIERGEAFTQLPIPCGGADGPGCEEVAARFCETLGYGDPIAALDVEGDLYAIRCEDEL